MGCADLLCAFADIATLPDLYARTVALWVDDCLPLRALANLPRGAYKRSLIILTAAWTALL